MELGQKGEQFRILEEAVAPPDPTWPNRWLIIGLGLFLGASAAAGLAVLLEATDTSFHGPHDLQVDLKIPVLASIPSIELESDLIANRRRHIKQGFAAATLVAVVLAISVAGNWYVNGVPGWVSALTQGGAQETAALIGES